MYLISFITYLTLGICVVIDLYRRVYRRLSLALLSVDCLGSAPVPAGHTDSSRGKWMQLDLRATLAHCWVYRDIVDLRWLGIDLIDSNVLSSTRPSVFSFSSLHAPFRCVIPFNTVIMVPIYALYILYICQCSTTLINVRASGRGTGRGRHRVVLADKKANGVIHDRSTNNNKNNNNKNNNKMCVRRQIRYNTNTYKQFNASLRVSTKRLCAPHGIYTCIYRRTDSYKCMYIYGIYSDLYGLIRVRLISVSPAAFAISLSLLSNAAIRSYVT